MAELEDALPATMVSGLQDQLRRIDAIDRDIEGLEKQISGWHKQEAACWPIAEVPGIGRLTATALIATIEDAKTFKSAASLPRSSGWCHGKAAPGARSGWDPSPGEVIPTCARC